MLLAFAEDFNKIIVNFKRELILLQSKDDSQVFKSNVPREKGKLSILNIRWKVPHVQLAFAYKQEIYKIVNSCCI